MDCPAGAIWAAFSGHRPPLQKQQSGRPPANFSPALALRAPPSRFSCLREIRSPSSAFILQASFFILKLRFLVSRTAGQTESEVVEPVDRDEAVAVGNSGAVGAVAPATATDAAVGGICDILAPLPHISAHVINP